MKLFGSIKELVSAVFRKDTFEVTVRPNQTSTYTGATDIQLPEDTATTQEIVGKASTQTLTNKTIAAGSNTISGLAHGSEVDSPSSGVHGVTGSVVGTTDAQTLTSKTIIGGTHDFSTAVASSLVIPKDTFASLDALARDEAALYYDTTNSRLVIDDGTDLAGISGEGGGAGEINFNSNPNALVALDNDGTDDVGDWLDTGTGTTASRTQTGSEIPRSPIQETAIKIVVEASGTDHTYLRFRIPVADRGKKNKIEWAQTVGSTYATGDLEVGLESWSDNYSSDQATVSITGSTDIPASSGVYYLEFDADDREYYELRISRVANGGAGTDWISLNDVVIGPGKLHSGAVVTAWELDSSPGGLAPTTGGNFTFDSNELVWRRVGDTLECILSAGNLNVATTTPSGILGFDVAAITGLSITVNELLLPTESSNSVLTAVGVWSAHDANAGASTSRTGGVATYHHNTNVIQLHSAPATGSELVSEAIPWTWQTGDDITVKFSVPITEWAGSGVLNTLVQDNLTEWTDFSADWGGTAPTSTNHGVYRRVGDTMEVEAAFEVTTADGTSGGIILTIPNELSLDLTKFRTDTTLGGFGAGQWNDTGAGIVVGINSSYNSATTIAIIKENEGRDSLDGDEFAVGDELVIRLSLPIAEWAGSQSSLVGFSQASDTAAGLLDYYKTESFTASFTGNAGASSGGNVDVVFEVTRVGNTVTLSTGQTSIEAGTANATFFAATTIPAGYRPQGSVFTPWMMQDNGTNQTGALRVGSNGDIFIYGSDTLAGNFTVAATTTLRASGWSWIV